ncbi:hypothetical protein [Streptomyces sp. NRRL F-5053]|uniref:hypothetical protein n=1 Tax=Streptomyces sp. NRRL F-5053 TaxID=1463854 RepID=UPI0004C5833D|nr:hypothetical protein [Streptomyces sp. NRRL F-5053]
MNQPTYPRTAAAIVEYARMTLAAYCAVPGREATRHLAASLHDMWDYGFFALYNDDTSTTPWTQTQTSEQLHGALQLLKFAPARSAHAARAAANAIHRFEHAAGITPGTAPEPFRTRIEAEQAVHAPSNASACTPRSTTNTPAGSSPKPSSPTPTVPTPPRATPPTTQRTTATSSRS